MIKKHTRDKFYIVKPENSSQGKGIFLINNLSKLDRTAQAIVQKYITNPMLIEGLKFDLRIYVLITCVQPLRVFLYNDGLVRLATEQFEKPGE